MLYLGGGGGGELPAPPFKNYQLIFKHCLPVLPLTLLAAAPLFFKSLCKISAYSPGHGQNVNHYIRQKLQDTKSYTKLSYRSFSQHWGCLVSRRSPLLQFIVHHFSNASMHARMHGSTHAHTLTHTHTTHILTPRPKNGNSKRIYGIW